MPQYNVTTEKPRHRQVARLLASGMTVAEVAAATGYTTQYVGILQRSPLMKRLVSELQARMDNAFIDTALVDLGKRLDEIAVKAVNKLEDIIDYGESESVQLGASREVLDRAPNAPKAARKIEGEMSHRHVVLTADDVAAIHTAVVNDPSMPLMAVESYPLLDAPPDPDAPPDADLFETAPAVRSLDALIREADEREKDLF